MCISVTIKKLLCISNLAPDINTSMNAVLVSAMLFCLCPHCALHKPDANTSPIQRSVLCVLMMRTVMMMMMMMMFLLLLLLLLLFVCLFYLLAAAVVACCCRCLLLMLLLLLPPQSTKHQTQHSVDFPQQSITKIKHEHERCTQCIRVK